MPMNNNNERLRLPIAYLTSFVLSILLTVLVALFVFKQTFFTQQAVFKAFDQSSYVNIARESLIENSKEIIIQYGVDESIIDDLYNPIQFEEDLKGSLQSIWTKQVYQIDSSILDTEIKARLNQFLVNQGLTITTEVQVGIDEASQLIIDEYQKKSTIPLLSAYRSIMVTYEKYLNYSELILGVLLIGLTYFLYRLLSKSKVSLFIGYALATSSWLMFLLALYFRVDGFYTRIQIRPEYINKLLVILGSNTLNLFIYLSLGGIGLSLFLFYMAYHKDKS